MTVTLREFWTYTAPDGTRYPLEIPSTIGRWVISDSGTGLPPLDAQSSRGPQQHGATLNEIWLLPRVVQLLIRQNYCSREAYWAGRASLLDALRFNRQSTAGALDPGVLCKVLPAGDKRCLDVYLTEGPRFEPRQPGQWQEWSFQEVLRFTAYNPVWYDPAQQTSALTLAGSETIAFRAAAAGNTNDSTSVNITIARPTGTVAGDVMVAGIIVATTSSAVDGFVTPPAGWTLVRAIGASTDGILYLYSKTAGASEPTSYTWSGPQGGLTARGMAGIIAAFSGVTQSSSFNVENAQATSGTTFTAPNVTTTVANCMGVLIVGAEETTNVWSGQLIDNAAATEPANGDKQNDSGGAADDCTISVAYRAIGAAQAVNTNTANKAGTDSGSAWIGALAPAAAVSGNITYVGTWLEYPVLTLAGPLVSPVISNTTTGETLSFGITLLVGETLTIDLRYGSKTVIKSDGSNQIGTLTPESDLATFHLAPDPEAPGGVNAFTLRATAGDTGSLTVAWYARYIGI